MEDSPLQNHWLTVSLKENEYNGDHMWIHESYLIHGTMENIYIHIFFNIRDEMNEVIKVVFFIFMVYTWFYTYGCYKLFHPAHILRLSKHICMFNIVKKNLFIPKLETSCFFYSCYVHTYTRYIRLCNPTYAHHRDKCTASCYHIQINLARFTLWSLQ